MERYMIFIPAVGPCKLVACDDGDSIKLETMQELVGGPMRTGQRPTVSAPAPLVVAVRRAIIIGNSTVTGWPGSTGSPVVDLPAVPAALPTPLQPAPLTVLLVAAAAPKPPP